MTRSASSPYTAGDEVAYNGDNWTANQWSYEAPGSSSGAWTSPKLRPVW